MKKSEDHFEKALEVMPGGVNSSTRLNQALGIPFFASRGKGPFIWDLEDKKYIDLCCGHGAALLGHGHTALDKAMKKAMRMGYVSMFETEYHEELARKVCSYIPCAEKVRFCNSGSESTLHLLRACRAFTGKNKIIRIEGHFHGYHELIYIGGQPPREYFHSNRRSPYIESAGIPDEFARLVIPIPYNDEDALKKAIEKHSKETAVLIIEPVNYNSGCILPKPGYLELCRELTNNAGIILFFDEIQSAFKKSIGGAQQDFGVIPDVCTIGKSPGGGLPLSAFCGKIEVMDMFKPLGNVQHSGTFNAPLTSVLSGLAFLREIKKPYFYQTLRRIESRFHSGIDDLIEELQLNLIVPHHGARFDIVLGRKTPPMRYEDTFCHREDLFLKILKECWKRGLYLHDYGGKPVHHGYSIQHKDNVIDEVLNIFSDVFKIFKEDLQE